MTADGYFPGPPKGGGGILLVPAVAGSYILKGVSYYEPEDITSPVFEILIYISLRRSRRSLYYPPPVLTEDCSVPVRSAQLGVQGGWASGEPRCVSVPWPPLWMDGDP